MKLATVPVTTGQATYLATLPHSTATCGYSPSFDITIKQGLPCNRLLHGWLPLTLVNGAACSTTRDNFASQRLPVDSSYLCGSVWLSFVRFILFYFFLFFHEMCQAIVGPCVKMTNADAADSYPRFAKFDVILHGTQYTPDNQIQIMEVFIPFTQRYYRRLILLLNTTSTATCFGQTTIFR
jgi:hypothetical protein